MAEKDASKAVEPPKPVNIGGESLLDRIRPYIKQIVIGTIGLAVVLLVIFGVQAFRERGERKTTEQLNRALELSRQPIRGKDEKPDPKKPSFASAKERAIALLAAPGIDAAGPAYRAGLLLDADKIDDAIAEYRKGIADKSIMGVLCREGLGIALETKAAASKDATARQKGFEDALAAFAAMQPDEAGPRRAYALYHQGRLQLLLGKRSEARASFEAAKLANKDVDREIAELIEKRLATLGAS
jgi:tetratricopeptide (TPR) repeat protein